MDGEADFSFPMYIVSSHLPTLEGVEAKVVVDITEFFMGMTQSGYAVTRLITSNLKLRFLTTSPAIFKPGMPFEGHVSIPNYTILKPFMLGIGMQCSKANL